MQEEAERWLAAEGRRTALEEIQRKREAWWERKERAYQERKRREAQERMSREVEIESLLVAAGRNRGGAEAGDAALAEAGGLSVGGSTAGCEDRPQVCNGSQDWYRG